MTLDELYCDSSDGSKRALMYATADLADGEHRGRCNYPCNPDAQARWEALSADIAKSRATQKRQQQRLFRNDTTAKARVINYMSNWDTPAKSTARQKMFLGKMTTSHRKLYNRKKGAKQALSKTIKNIENGEHTSRMMSLVDRQQKFEAAEEALDAHVQSAAYLPTPATLVTPTAPSDVGADVDADEAVDADADVGEAVDAAVAAPPVSTKHKYEEIMESHWKALDIWHVKYNFI